MISVLDENLKVLEQDLETEANSRKGEVADLETKIDAQATQLTDIQEKLKTYSENKTVENLQGAVVELAKSNNLLLYGVCAEGVLIVLVLVLAIIALVRAKKQKKKLQTLEARMQKELKAQQDNEEISARNKIDFFKQIGELQSQIAELKRKNASLIDSSVVSPFAPPRPHIQPLTLQESIKVCNEALSRGHAPSQELYRHYGDAVWAVTCLPNGDLELKGMMKASAPEYIAVDIGGCWYLLPSWERDNGVVPAGRYFENAHAGARLMSVQQAAQLTVRGNAVRIIAQLQQRGRVVSQSDNPVDEAQAMLDTMDGFAFEKCAAPWGKKLPEYSTLHSFVKQKQTMTAMGGIFLTIAKAGPPSFVVASVAQDNQVAWLYPNQPGAEGQLIQRLFHTEKRLGGQSICRVLEPAKAVSAQLNGEKCWKLEKMGRIMI